jgi:hypothetical protein
MDKEIMELITSHQKMRVIFAAIQLRLFTHLANKSLTLTELCERCQAISHPLQILLNACHSMDLLKVKEGRYTNSQLSEKYLVEDQPGYIGDFLQLQNDESLHWNKLFQITYDGPTRRSEESRYRTFIKAMNNIGMLGEAEKLKEAVDLSHCKQMVDAGGGSGLYSVVLCREYSELSSTILDLKETLQITKEMISAYPEKERITLRQADIMKDSFGEEIDVVLLSDVIYDKQAGSIVLAKAWQCLKNDGTLIIRGYYADPVDTKPLFGALFAISQLVFDPKREVMTISDLEREVVMTGFTIIKVSPLTQLSFVLVAKKEV